MTPCTVKKTFSAARKTNCHLLVQLKENQPGLLRKIKAVTVDAPPLARHETTDKGKRMRVENRIVEIFNATAALELIPTAIITDLYEPNFAFRLI